MATGDAYQHIKAPVGLWALSVSHVTVTHFKVHASILVLLGPSYLTFFPLTWTPSSSCVSLCSATYSPDNPAMLALFFSPYALELLLSPCFLCSLSPANLPSQADSLDLVQKVGHVQSICSLWSELFEMPLAVLVYLQ